MTSKNIHIGAGLSNQQSVCGIAASRSEDYDCDCMAFVLLSHGEDGGMIHGTDDVVAIDQLLLPLKHEPNMKHFAGKPKLVFVQVMCFCFIVKSVVSSKQSCFL